MRNKDFVIASPEGAKQSLLDCFVARLNIARLLAMTIFFCFLFSVLCSLSHADTAHGSAAKVEKLFLMEKYDKAVSEADKLIDERADKHDEIYYLKGLSEIKLKRYANARESFEYILSGYPGSKIAFDACTGMGDAYYLEGNTHSAMRVYNEILSRFPNDKNINIIKRRLENCGKKIEPPPEAPKGNFSIQVGGFKEKRNADNLARKLVSKGYDSYVDPPAASGSDNLYRVKVGRLGSAEEARRLAARLKVNGYPTKICPDDLCR